MIERHINKIEQIFSHFQDLYRYKREAMTSSKTRRQIGSIKRLTIVRIIISYLRTFNTMMADEQNQGEFNLRRKRVHTFSNFPKILNLDK